MHALRDPPERLLLVHRRRRVSVDVERERPDALASTTPAHWHRMAQPELRLKETATRTTHPKPDLARVDAALKCSYSPSRDGVDANLLVLFHGLGAFSVSRTLLSLRSTDSTSDGRQATPRNRSPSWANRSTSRRPPCSPSRRLNGYHYSRKRRTSGGTALIRLAIVSREVSLAATSAGCRAFKVAR